jgi:sugar phosphate isomerase/epimerase
VGALPGALAGKPAYKDIQLARDQVFDGIGATLEYATKAGMPLAIEPLHPMQAAERACVNTLEQALDICDALDPEKSGALGVAVDVYHVWWDPKLAAQIERAGRERLLAFHVCDWLLPTRDLLNDRGMMGDGIIELRKIRGFMEDAGYRGAAEVEIFSEDWWARPLDGVLATCIERHRTVV